MAMRRDGSARTKRPIDRVSPSSIVMNSSAATSFSASARSMSLRGCSNPSTVNKGTAQHLQHLAPRTRKAFGKGN